MNFILANEENLRKWLLFPFRMYDVPALLVSTHEVSLKVLISGTDNRCDCVASGDHLRLIRSSELFPPFSHCLNGKADCGGIGNQSLKKLLNY